MVEGGVVVGGVVVGVVADGSSVTVVGTAGSVGRSSATATAVLVVTATNTPAATSAPRRLRRRGAALPVLPVVGKPLTARTLPHFGRKLQRALDQLLKVR